MPDLMQALKACFINYKANSDKPRRAAMEALSTVHFLTMQYPELFSAACIADEELRESIFNCCIKDAFSLRSKGCMALGGLYHSIYQPRPGAHQEQEQDRRTSVDLLGAYLMEFLQHQDHFNLRVLEKLLEGAKAKPEEGTLDLLLPFSVNLLKLACTGGRDVDDPHAWSSTCYHRSTLQETRSCWTCHVDEAFLCASFLVDLQDPQC